MTTDVSRENCPLSVGFRTSGFQISAHRRFSRPWDQFVACEYKVLRTVVKSIAKVPPPRLSLRRESPAQLNERLPSPPLRRHAHSIFPHRREYPPPRVPRLSPPIFVSYCHKPISRRVQSIATTKRFAGDEQGQGRSGRCSAISFFLFWVFLCFSVFSAFRNPLF